MRKKEGGREADREEERERGEGEKRRPCRERLRLHEKERETERENKKERHTVREREHSAHWEKLLSGIETFKKMYQSRLKGKEFLIGYMSGPFSRNVWVFFPVLLSASLNFVGKKNVQELLAI